MTVWLGCFQSTCSLRIGLSLIAPVGAQCPVEEYRKSFAPFSRGSHRCIEFACIRTQFHTHSLIRTTVSERLDNSCHLFPLPSTPTASPGPSTVLALFMSLHLATTSIAETGDTSHQKTQGAPFGASHTHITPSPSPTHHALPKAKIFHIRYCITLSREFLIPPHSGELCFVISTKSVDSITRQFTGS